MRGMELAVLVTIGPALQQTLNVSIYRVLNTSLVPRRPTRTSWQPTPTSATTPAAMSSSTSAEMPANATSAAETRCTKLSSASCSRASSLSTPHYQVRWWWWIPSIMYVCHFHRSWNSQVCVFLAWQVRWRRQTDGQTVQILKPDSQRLEKVS
jgi:hypothetical protein